jgi:hypothetical protein
LLWLAVAVMPDVYLDDEDMLADEDWGADWADGGDWDVADDLAMYADGQWQDLLVGVDRSGAVQHRIEPPGAVTGAALGDQGVWVTDCWAGLLSLLDLDSGQLIGDPIQIGRGATSDLRQDVEADGAPYDCPTAVTIGGDTIWVANTGAGTLVPVK